jgi:predicted permease
MLLGAVALLLLIACVNGANLLLALGTELEGELAVRAALGAGRLRLAGHLLARSLVVAVLGGAAGVLVAWIATSAALPLVASYLPRAGEVKLDWRVVTFAVALVMFSALLAGLAPALGATRTDLRQALGQGRGASSSPSRRRLRDALVVSEIALAFALMAAAGLMAKSLVRLSLVDTGFRTESVMTARVSLPMAMERYRREALRRRFWDELTEKVAALPGVTASGLVSSLPFGGTAIPFRFRVGDGAGVLSDDEVREAEYRAVSPGYFGTIGIRLVAGRLFTERDGRDGQGVAIVNETLARRLWPDGSAGASVSTALGRSLSVNGPKGPFWPIVGVVADVRHFGPDRPPAPEIYVTYAQEAWPEMAVVARGTAGPAVTAAGLRAAVGEIDRELGVYQVRPFADVVGQTTALRRLVTGLLSAFSATALLLAAVGVSGLLAFTVALRRREIGVRLALGASPSGIVRLIVWHGLRLACTGGAIGLAAWPWVGALIRSQLFGVEPFDLPMLAAMAAALILVALGASAVPAVRASRVDPNVVLRFE